MSLYGLSMDELKIKLVKDIMDRLTLDKNTLTKTKDKKRSRPDDNVYRFVND